MTSLLYLLCCVLIIQLDFVFSTNEHKYQRMSYGAAFNLPGSFSLRAVYVEGTDTKYVNYYQDADAKTSRIEMLDKDNKPIKAYVTYKNKVIMLTKRDCEEIKTADAELLNNYDFRNFQFGKEEVTIIRGKKVKTQVFEQPDGAKNKETFYIITDKWGKQIPVRGCISGSICMDIQKFCTKTPNSKFFEIDTAKCKGG